MREYEMPVEEQLKILVKKFGEFETKLDETFSAIDARFDAVDVRFDAVDARLEAVDARFDAVDARFDSVDARLDKVDASLSKLQVRVDDVRDIAKLGLEGIEGLRESTDSQFAVALKRQDEQTALLKSLFVHLRKRVERVEPTRASKARRRRS
jgi:chromosome segregation ATPase